MKHLFDRCNRRTRSRPFPRMRIAVVVREVASGYRHCETMRRQNDGRTRSEIDSERVVLAGLQRSTATVCLQPRHSAVAAVLRSHMDRRIDQLGDDTRIAHRRVGQGFVTSLMFVRQLRMVQAQLMQNRRKQIGNADRAFD